MPVVGGHTKIYGLIGHPLQHTLSPHLHNAAFAAAGLDSVYLPFPVLPGWLPDAVRGLRALRAAGWNVTLPYKTAVIGLLDETAPEAKAAGTVNTIVNRGGRLYGYSTDGAGFICSLAENGVKIDGKNVLLLGAGGAARAVAFRLLQERAEQIVIANRTEARAAVFAADLRKYGGRAVRIMTVPWRGAETSAAAADIIINATPLGLRPETDPFPPLSFRTVRTDSVVCDLIYNPPLTPFLAAAAARGCKTVGGIGMLVHQAAEAFELWTGQAAPVQVMREAAKAALTG